MEILFSMVSLITAFLFFMVFIYLVRYIWGKIRRKDTATLKKKAKQSGIAFVICYAAAIFSGIMAGSMEGAYVTVSTEVQRDENKENLNAAETEKAVDDGPKEMKEKALTYTTLLTYPYSDSRKGKNITAIIQASKAAEEKDFSYLDENGKLASDKKTYEITVKEVTDYIYYGKVKKDKPDGYGILYYDRYPTYIGEFSKGVKDGYGIEIAYSELENAYFISYEGNFKNGLRDGSGKEYQEYVEGILSDSYYYEANLYEKQVLRYTDLRYDLPLIDNTIIYEGEFEDGSYGGKGIRYDIRGIVMYEGEFESGKYDGKGSLYYENGKIHYEGSFQNGEYDGKGTLYNEDGSVQYKGKFKRGDIK